MSADLSDAKTEAAPSESVDSAELADMVGTDSEFEGVAERLEEGQEIAGRYKIVRHLGDGGMGNVYLAEHTAIKKQVALKTLSLDLSKRKIQRERFLREARSASKIRHPNVVDITDFGSTEEGAPFIAMEYLDGEDLKETLRREGRISFERARDLVLQILAALQAAHDEGIIHRDVKPANCFRVNQSGSFDVIKVVDFGIAKTTVDSDNADLTKTGVIVGTAAYMAPEQARGDGNVDHRADVYSVGVILFRMLTGKLPYTSTSPLGMITRHLTDPVPSIREIAPEAGLSAAVDKIVQRALAKDREQRWQSAAELASALEAIEEPLAGPRRWGIWIAAAGIAVLVLGGLGWMLEAGQTAEADAETKTARASALGREAPTPPKVEPAPPEPPVLPEVAPKTVSVTLEGAPEGAHVFDGDEDLGPASEALSLDRSEDTLTLEIVAPGYQSKPVSFAPVADLKLDASLEVEAKTKKLKKTKKGDGGKGKDIDKELGF